MWYGLFLIIAAVLAAGLTIVAAGPFLVICIVIAVIAGLGSLFSLGAARRAKLAAALHADAGAGRDIRRDGGAAETGAGRVPATPEELVRARQAAQ